MNERIAYVLELTENEAIVIRQLVGATIQSPEASAIWNALVDAGVTYKNGRTALGQAIKLK